MDCADSMSHHDCEEPLCLTISPHNHPNLHQDGQERCKRCAFSSTNEHELSIHKHAHTARAHFTCKLCQFSVNSRTMMSSHLKVHQHSIRTDRDTNVPFDLYVLISTEDLGNCDEYSSRKAHFDSFSFGDELHVSSTSTSDEGQGCMVADSSPPSLHCTASSSNIDSNHDNRCSSVTPIRPFCSDQKSKPVAIVHGSRVADSTNKHNETKVVLSPPDEGDEYRNNAPCSTAVAHKCSYCPYVTTKSLHHLKIHEQCHTVINKFSCCDCGYSESQLWQVRKHLLLHGRSAKIIRNPAYVGGDSPAQQASPTTLDTEHDQSKTVLYDNDKITGQPDESSCSDSESVKHPPSKAALKYYDPGAKQIEARELSPKDIPLNVDVPVDPVMSPIHTNEHDKSTMLVLESSSHKYYNSVSRLNDDCQMPRQQDHSPSNVISLRTGETLDPALHTTTLRKSPCQQSQHVESKLCSSKEMTEKSSTSSPDYDCDQAQSMTLNKKHSLPIETVEQTSLCSPAKPTLLSNSSASIDNIALFHNKTISQETHLKHTNVSDTNESQLHHNTATSNVCTHSSTYHSGNNMLVSDSTSQYPNTNISISQQLPLTNDYSSRQSYQEQYGSQQSGHSPNFQTYISVTQSSSTNTQFSPNLRKSHSSPRHGAHSSPQHSRRHISDHIRNSPSTSYPLLTPEIRQQSMSTPEQNYEKLTEVYGQTGNHEKNSLDAYGAAKKGALHNEYLNVDRNSRSQLPFTSDGNSFHSPSHAPGRSVINDFSHSLLGQIAESNMGSSNSRNYNYVTPDINAIEFNRSYDSGRSTLDYPNIGHNSTSNFSSFANPTGQQIPFANETLVSNFNNYHSSHALGNTFPATHSYQHSSMNFDSSRVLNNFSAHNYDLQTFREPGQYPQGHYTNTEAANHIQRNVVDNHSNRSVWSHDIDSSQTPQPLPSLGSEANSHLVSMESMSQSVTTVEERFDTPTTDSNRWPDDAEHHGLQKVDPLPLDDFDVPPPSESNANSNDAEIAYKRIFEDNWSPIHHTSTIEATLPFAAQQNALNPSPIEEHIPEQEEIDTIPESHSLNDHQTDDVTAIDRVSSSESADLGYTPEHRNTLQEGDTSKRKRYRNNISPKRCRYCPFVTHGNLRHLEIHQRCHKIQSKFTCNICGYSVPHNSNLWAHRQLHRSHNEITQLIKFGPENDPALKSLTESENQNSTKDGENGNATNVYEISPNTLSETPKRLNTERLSKRRHESRTRLTVAQKRNQLVVDRTNCKYCPFKASKPCANGYYLSLHERHHFMSCKFTCDVCRYSAPHLITVKKHKMLHKIEKEGNMKQYPFPEREPIAYQIKHRGENSRAQHILGDKSSLSAADEGIHALLDDTNEGSCDSLSSTPSSKSQNNAASRQNFKNIKIEKTTEILADCDPFPPFKRKKIFTAKRNKGISSVAFFISKLKSRGKRGRPKKILPAGVIEASSQKETMLISDDQTLWECKYCPFVTSGVHAAHNLGCHHKCHEQASDFHCDQCTFCSPTAAGIDKHKLFHNPEHRAALVSKILAETIGTDAFSTYSTTLNFHSSKELKGRRPKRDNGNAPVRHKVQLKRTRSLPKRDAKDKSKPIIDYDEKSDVESDSCDFRNSRVSTYLKLNNRNCTEHVATEPSTLNQTTKDRMSDTKEANDTILEWQKTVYASPYPHEFVEESHDLPYNKVHSPESTFIENDDSCEGDAVTERPTAQHKLQHHTDNFYSLCLEKNPHSNASISSNDTVTLESNGGLDMDEHISNRVIEDNRNLSDSQMLDTEYRHRATDDSSSYVTGESATDVSLKKILKIPKQKQNDRLNNATCLRRTDYDSEHVKHPDTRDSRDDVQFTDDQITSSKVQLCAVSDEENSNLLYTENCATNISKDNTDITETDCLHKEPIKKIALSMSLSQTTAKVKTINNVDVRSDDAAIDHFTNDCTTDTECIDHSVKENRAASSKYRRKKSKSKKVTLGHNVKGDSIVQVKYRHNDDQRRKSNEKHQRSRNFESDHHCRNLRNTQSMRRRYSEHPVKCHLRHSSVSHVKQNSNSTQSKNVKKQMLKKQPHNDSKLTEIHPKPRKHQKKRPCKTINAKGSWSQLTHPIELKLTWKMLSLLHNKALIDSAREVEPSFLQKLKGKIGDNVYGCDKCAFIAYGKCPKSELIEHELAHDGKAPYKCSACSYSISDKDYLQKHYYYIHSQPSQLWMNLIKHISSEDLTSLLMIYATLPTTDEGNNFDNEIRNNDKAIATSSLDAKYQRKVPSHNIPPNIVRYKKEQPSKLTLNKQKHTSSRTKVVVKDALNLVTRSKRLHISSNSRKLRPRRTLLMKSNLRSTRKPRRTLTECSIPTVTSAKKQETAITSNVQKPETVNTCLSKKTGTKVSQNTCYLKNEVTCSNTEGTHSGNMDLCPKSLTRSTRTFAAKISSDIPDQKREKILMRTRKNHQKPSKGSRNNWHPVRVTSSIIAKDDYRSNDASKTEKRDCSKSTEHYDSKTSKYDGSISDIGNHSETGKLYDFETDRNDSSEAMKSGKPDGSKSLEPNKSNLSMHGDSNCDTHDISNANMGGCLKSNKSFDEPITNRCSDSIFDRPDCSKSDNHDDTTYMCYGSKYDQHSSKSNKGDGFGCEKRNSLNFGKRHDSESTRHFKSIPHKRQRSKLNVYAHDDIETNKPDCSTSSRYNKRGGSRGSKRDGTKSRKRGHALSCMNSMDGAGGTMSGELNCVEVKDKPLLCQKRCLDTRADGPKRQHEFFSRSFQPSATQFEKFSPDELSTKNTSSHANRPIINTRLRQRNENINCEKRVAESTEIVAERKKMCGKLKHVAVKELRSCRKNAVVKLEKCNITNLKMNKIVVGRDKGKDDLERYIETPCRDGDTSDTEEYSERTSPENATHRRIKRNCGRVDMVNISPRYEIEPKQFSQHSEIISKKGEVLAIQKQAKAEKTNLHKTAIETQVKCPDCPYKASELVVKKHQKAHNVMAFHKCKTCSFSSNVLHHVTRHELLHSNTDHGDMKVPKGTTYVSQLSCNQSDLQNEINNCPNTRNNAAKLMDVSNKILQSKLSETITNANNAFNGMVEAKSGTGVGSEDTTRHMDNETLMRRQKRLGNLILEKNMVKKYTEKNEFWDVISLTDEAGNRCGMNSTTDKHVLYQCRVCPFTSYCGGPSLLIHERCHESVSKYRCKICSYSSDRLLQLRRHAALHGRRTKTIGLTSESKKQKCCPFCYFRSSINQIMLNHINESHNQTNLDNLTSGNQGKRKNNMSAAPVCKVYTCRFCDFTTAILPRYVCHEKCHTNRSGKYMCHICNYSAQKLKNITNHKNSHHKRNKYGQYIKKYCKALKTLRSPKPPPSSKPNLMTTERNYKCNYCPFYTVLSSLAKDHYRHHVNQSLYTCLYCTYSDDSKDDLLLHGKLHFTVLHQDAVKISESPLPPIQHQVIRLQTTGLGGDVELDVDICDDTDVSLIQDADFSAKASTPPRRCEYKIQCQYCELRVLHDNLKSHEAQHMIGSSYLKYQ